MNIKDHGEWEPYVPDPWPYHLVGDIRNILFSRRLSDGRDWYDFSRKELAGLDTIKLTLWKPTGEWTVATTNHNAQHLFPNKMRVLEVDDMPDHEQLRQQRFDDKTKTFLPALPPPQQPNMFRAIMEELGWDKEKMQRVMNRSKDG